jgi:hypothetical protein
MVSDKSGHEGRQFLHAAGKMSEPTPAALRKFGQRMSTYPQNEQNTYSMAPEALPDGPTANSSELSTLICNAAMRRENFRRGRLDFHANALISRRGVAYSGSR